MRRWGANLGAESRACKASLLTHLKYLDALADSVGISADDWMRRYTLESSLMEIYKSEELFWQRHGGQMWLLQGEENTAHFHAIANGRWRRCAISCLWEGENILEHPDEIRSHIYSFYKELFSTAP
ncbi:retrotransposon unclassified [Hordeum vulgare]|nr:retrotransposon unclassified [Hordeum vulgare]